jgi:3-phytase
MTRFTYAALFAVTVCAACSPDQRSGADSAIGNGSAATPAAPPVITEVFLTPRDTADNIDSPAVWHGPGGQHWLLSTAKMTDVIVVNDAITGAELRRVGGAGKAAGKMERPNGIAVVDDMMWVVERDNARVQIFSLPEFRSLGIFGEGQLKKPYGLAINVEQPGRYVVYVTDNYETPDEQVPPDRELGARVKQYRVRTTGGRVGAELVRAFGDTTGAGVLKVVESIAVDVPNRRLLIAEELETDSHINVYDLDGRYVGREFGRGHFPQQAEGIVLYACGDTAGYWLTTDQGTETNTYHVFDRMSFEHVGAFSGARTKNTDGVALTQESFGPFRNGAFYAVHDDGNVAAFQWSDIAGVLTLRADCTR